MLSVSHFDPPDLKRALKEMVAAYESLFKSTRQRSYRDIGMSLEKKFPAEVEAEAKEQCEKALLIAKKIGAHRFEPVNQDVLSKILAVESNHNDVMTMINEAITTDREIGFKFSGPMTLGALSMVADDPETREKSVAEGEMILKQECVSHNYLCFYRDAIDACLNAGDWGGVERFATAAEIYTDEQQLPWMDLRIRRGRALEKWGQNGQDSKVATELEDIRQTAISVNFNTIVPMIDAVLAN